jgi:hypothetical protein
MGKRKRGNVFGKNRIMIRPKDDGTYMIELRIAAREALAISNDGEMEDPIPRGIDRDELAPLKEAGLVLHGLRATAVVRLRRAGATTGQIAGMVGMSEVMVNRYCRFSVQRENALAAVHYLDTRTKPERPKADSEKSKT